jgi:exonuclease III
VSFRVVSWNMHCAGRSSEAWEYLLQLEPDIALLQEVIEIPDGVADRFSVLQLRARWKDGGQQRFSTVVLAAGGPCESDALESKMTWVNEELARFAGNVVSTRVRLGEADLRVVSVHSPAWPIPGERIKDFDASEVKLTQQKVDIWVADLLSAAIPRRTAGEWIIGGDFNLSETFDAWPGGPRGNREYLDRMINAGYTECLRTATGQVTTTFKPRGPVGHQIDHIFVSAPLAKRLLTCEVGLAERVFDGGLSDHLPIIAVFAD